MFEIGLASYSWLLSGLSLSVTWDAKVVLQCFWLCCSDNLVISYWLFCVYIHRMHWIRNVMLGILNDSRTLYNVLWNWQSSLNVEMRCNACWRELEGQAITTTCGHVFCILVLYVFHIDMHMFCVCFSPQENVLAVEELELQSWESSSETNRGDTKLILSFFQSLGGRIIRYLY